MWIGSSGSRAASLARFRGRRSVGRAGGLPTSGSGDCPAWLGTYAGEGGGGECVAEERADTASGEDARWRKLRNAALVAALCDVVAGVDCDAVVGTRATRLLFLVFLLVLAFLVAVRKGTTPTRAAKESKVSPGGALGWMKVKVREQTQEAGCVV